MIILFCHRGQSSELESNKLVQSNQSGPEDTQVNSSIYMVLDFNVWKIILFKYLRDPSYLAPLIIVNKQWCREILAYIQWNDIVLPEFRGVDAKKNYLRNPKSRVDACTLTDWVSQLGLFSDTSIISEGLLEEVREKKIYYDLILTAMKAGIWFPIGTISGRLSILTTYIHFSGDFSILDELYLESSMYSQKDVDYVTFILEGDCPIFCKFYIDYISKFKK